VVGLDAGTAGEAERLRGVARQLRVSAFGRGGRGDPHGRQHAGGRSVREPDVAAAQRDAPEAGAAQEVDVLLQPDAVRSAGDQRLQGRSGDPCIPHRYRIVDILQTV
jgi:hypothetical protein